MRRFLVKGVGLMNVQNLRGHRVLTESHNVSKMIQTEGGWNFLWDFKGREWRQISNVRPNESSTPEPELVVRRVDHTTAVITDLEGHPYSDQMPITEACALLKEVSK